MMKRLMIRNWAGWIKKERKRRQERIFGTFIASRFCNIPADTRRIQFNGRIPSNVPFPVNID